MFENERDYLNKLIDHFRDALTFFSSANKVERERATVRAFLRSIAEEFSEQEIVFGPEEPIDISFRSAKFQIKETLGGRKRSDEFRDRLRRAQNALHVKDVMESWASSKEMSFEEALQLVSSSLASYARKLGANQCSELDALVYVNPTGRHLWPLPAQARSANTLNQQGWRSVSMLFPPYGVVIAARPCAPDFLQARAGQILRCPHPDGCFGAER
jgi:hypothetical protein